MTRLVPTTLLALATLAVSLGLSPMAGEAKDYGQAGHVFPVIEPDLLTMIETRLRRAEASGELARMDAAFVRRVERKVRQPDPVAGITRAERSRNWDYDPSIVLERDIRDHGGRLIAAAGQKINPLDFVRPRQELVFVHGDDPAQMAWALSRYGEAQAKIILVSGSPIEEMTRRQRRFYFDQAGRLTSRFGIRHTPAVVKTAGKVMRVSEVVIKQGGAG